MAIATVTISDAEAPLLNDTVEGFVDFKGRPVSRSKSGGWKSGSFIIGVEVAERFAYYGISSNLISYLTGPLGQSIATAAANVNAWSGTASLLPLLGAFLADSVVGRYRMITGASILYVLGLGLLSLSALLFSYNSHDCQSVQHSISCSTPQFQIILFFFSLYVVALAQGGHKPCVQAFGADQFDELDPKECKAKSSFFNWWYFCFCAGVLVALFILSYIQDNLSWALGFGIPCIVMCLALVLFLLGAFTYRFQIQSDERNPFLRIGQVFVRAAKNWETTSLTISMEEEAQGILPHEGSEQFNFISLSIVLFIPIYDRILVPTARSMTRKLSGISMLQRVGTGIVLSFLSMVIAAFVEKKRIETALEHGLVDLPKATVPMSVWWLIPQYLLFGISDVFTMVGLQEFFYDQVPKELKSVGLALYLSIFGIGSFLSSFLISVIENATSGPGQYSWFSNNLSRAHLDYFYWLLAGISAFVFMGYLYFAKSYIYNNRKGSI